MPEFIDVSGEGLYSHEVGNKDCDAGWCGSSGYPRPCKCGGLIHADFGDEDSDCNYWLYLKCDKCGEDYEEIEE
jgi:hypothetical protein